MDIFFKATACILLSLVLYLIVAKQSKDISVLLTVVVCVVIVTVALGRLELVLQFIERMETTAELNTDFLAVMLKAVGIGLIGEITGLICNDAGNSALAKALQILSTVIILWLSIPLFEALLCLIDEILVSI